MLEENALQFFLGANTPGGFVSRFDQLAVAEDGWRKLVIKGGPGSGKSTMMKKIVEKYKAKYSDMEIIRCSSDADSLDGVIIPALKLSIADGTLPHSIELRFPGAFESLIDLTSCLNEESLFANREDIIRLSKSCSSCHENACRFLSAAASVAADTHKISLDCLDIAKLSSYCDRLAEKEFRPASKRPGKEKVRFLSAVTNKGILKFTRSANKLCDRIYLISDDGGAVSRVILANVRAKAIANGYDVISCYCSLMPYDKLEQLFIPSLKLGFMTSNRFHNFTYEINPYRIINSQRFTSKNRIKAYKKRLSYNRKVMAQMIRQAAELIADAKSIHDELEGYYMHVTDFEKVDALTDQVMDRIEKLAYS